MSVSQTAFSDTLRAAASEALENLAFTEVTPREEGLLNGAATEYHGSRISLGTLGAMDLIIGQDLLSEIAVILFSPPDGEVPVDMLSDTLKEILNIIAGRFLERLFNGKSDFSLGLPETHLDVAEWNALTMRSVLVTDDGRELAVGINSEIRE